MTNTPDRTDGPEGARKRVPTVVRGVASNVRFGVQLGLFVAVAFAALSTISGLAGLSLGRPTANPFVSLHMTYLVGLACHLVAGVIGGLVGGLMRPLGRWLAGAMFIGFVLGATTWIVFSIGEYGREFWNTDTKEMTVVFACIGAIGAPYLRNKIRASARIGV